MSTTKMTELSVGLFIALGLVALFVLAIKVSDITSLGDERGYAITAHFENVGGLKVRSPVSMAGVRIGRVLSIGIDVQTYEAVVKLSIGNQYKLPEDTSASILTAGLLGRTIYRLGTRRRGALSKAGRAHQIDPIGSGPGAPDRSPADQYGRQQRITRW